MMIRYKIDILAALKDAGYSQNRIRKEKLIGQATLTQLRRGELVSWKTIDTICRLLNCQPGDILEYKNVPAELEEDTQPSEICDPLGQSLFGGVRLTLPEALKRLRKLKAVSQVQSASAAGVSAAQYQNYEYGKSEPTASVLIALADYFNVSLDYLVGRSDDPDRH